MASNRSKTRPAARKSRSVISFEMAVQLCPHSGIAEKVAENFGLLVPDYDGIREEHERTLRQMWHAFGDALNDKATQMHFQRIVGSLVSSAVGAGRFYSDKVIEARAANARAVDGGEEGGAPSASRAKPSAPASSLRTWRCKPTPSLRPRTAPSTPTRKSLATTGAPMRPGPKRRRSRSGQRRRRWEPSRADAARRGPEGPRHPSVLAILVRGEQR